MPSDKVIVQRKKSLLQIELDVFSSVQEKELNSLPSIQLLNQTISLLFGSGK